MNLLLGFAPFVLFAMLTRLAVDPALWLSFATAFAICIYDFLETRVLRTLDVASTVIFGVLALFRGFLVPGMDGSPTRLIIDISLFGIALASLVARQPITLQYARDEVPPEIFAAPAFIRANYIITLVWLAAFAIMAGADGAATFDPSVPVTGAVAAGLLALFAALTFTWQYPHRVSRKISARR